MWGLWLIQTKVFGLRQLNSHWWIRIAFKKKRHKPHYGRRTLAIKGCTFDAPHAPFAGIFTARKRSLQRLCFHRCLSVHGGGVSASGLGECGRHPPRETPSLVRHPRADTPHGRQPLGRYPPGQAPPVRHPPGRRHPLVADTPRHTPPSQTHPAGQTNPLLLNACWDMVNKRAVRMPLEWILVATSVPSITTTS